MLLSIVINVIFVMTIFTVRYYYAKQEMEFLVEDSERQDQLIAKNETSIDSISTITRRLQIDSDTQDQILERLSRDLYDIVRWSKEYEQRLQNLIDSVDVMRLEWASVESSTGAPSLIILSILLLTKTKYTFFYKIIIIFRSL